MSGVEVRVKLKLGDNSNDQIEYETSNKGFVILVGLSATMILGLFLLLVFAQEAQQ